MKLFACCNNSKKGFLEWNPESLYSSKSIWTQFLCMVGLEIGSLLNHILLYLMLVLQKDTIKEICFVYINPSLKWAFQAHQMLKTLKTIKGYNNWIQLGNVPVAHTSHIRHMLLVILPINSLSFEAPICQD